MKQIIATLLCCFCISAVNAEELPIIRDSIVSKSITTISINTLSGDTVTQVTHMDINDPNEWENEKSYVIDGDNNQFSFIWQSAKRNHHKKDPHWAGFGMGFMNYDSDKVAYGEMKASNSLNFTFNLASFSKQLGSNWMLVSGVGFDWSRYHFKDNAALTTVDGITAFVPAPQDVNYKSSKLLAYYVTLPLMLEYQVSDFYVTAGAVCYIKYYSKSQIKYYDEDGGKHKVNQGRDLNIRPIDLRLRAQIGIQDLGIYATYAPSSMFKKDKGPELKTYTLGVMFNF